MRSVKSGWVGRERALAEDEGSSGLRFVLPRLLRRPARLMGRLANGDFEAPRFAASIGTAGFLAASALYGAYLGGHLPVVAQAVTGRVGFAIDQIKVVGNRETSEIDILDRLELDGWTSLVGFDAEAARERIAKLPWVDVVAVRKVYPDAIEVRIDEKKAFALWQHGRELAIVERSGAVIMPYAGGKFASLPLIIGLGAPGEAADFVASVGERPELARRARAYVRVAERRWDVRLDNGVTIRLPERDPIAAVDDLIAMDAVSGLLSRDISSIDMRLGDRLVMQLTPDAVARREAALKAEAKALKKRAQKI